MDEFLDIISGSLKEYLQFPDEAIAHGFDERLDERKVQELDLPEEGLLNNEPTISAIDGGSNIIIKTPTSALVFNRVYCNKFVRMSKLEFYDLCTFISETKIVNEGGRPFFKTEIFPIMGKCPMAPIKVSSDDDCLKMGRLKGDLDRALSMARRFSEWSFVSKALRSGSEFVVIDGALQTAFTTESELANRVYEEARSAGTTVVGLSKSSTIYTQSGFPIAGLLDNMAKKRKLNKWIIRLGKSEEWAHRATVFYAKLHEGSDRAFRLDVFEGADEASIDRLLIALQLNSKYFAFPGYPYSLIDAHTYAKVADEEVKSIKDQILDRLEPEDAKKLELMEMALMPHDVLDQLGG